MPQTPGVADHAAPDDTVETPEPLVKAEVVRTILTFIIGAGWLAPIPDPVLGIIIPVAVTVLGAAVSAALTLIARGKVWALRKGVDVDAVVDGAQARTGPDAAR